MRIRPSVLVMSVVTVVPFGLAVRAEVRQRDEVRQREKEEREYRERREAEEKQRVEEYERQQAEEKAAFDQAIKLAIGARPGTPGSAFVDYALGSPATEQSTIDKPGFQADVQLLNGKRSSIAVAFKKHCEDVGGELEQLWSPNDTSIWIDAETHTRADHSFSSCLVSFERFVMPDEWIDKTPTAIVPAGAVGKPAETLRTRLAKAGYELNEWDDGFTWSDVGVGRGRELTKLRAFVDERGNVVGLTAMAIMADSTLEDLEARLTKLYGEPKEDDISLTWNNGRVRVLPGDMTTVQVGTVP